MKLFTQAYIAIGAVLLLHGAILLTGTYEYLHTDTVMHVLGGAAMGILGLAIHQNVAEKYHAKHSPLWYRYTFVVGFAMLIGIAWEFYEYILDQTVNVWYNLPMSQLSLADTMKDFLMDWLGASIAYFLLHRSV